jgi:hypothetical protein
VKRPEERRLVGRPGDGRARRRPPPRTGLGAGDLVSVPTRDLDDRVCSDGTAVLANGRQIDMCGINETIMHKRHGDDFGPAMRRSLLPVGLAVLVEHEA